MLPPLPADAVIVYVLRLKVAVTFFAPFMVTEHVPVPVHAPDQPPKLELLSGTAVKVTSVPDVYTSEQSDPQLMPAGEEVTMPAPVPAFVTFRLFCCIAVKLVLMV